MAEGVERPGRVPLRRLGHRQRGRHPLLRVVESRPPGLLPLQAEPPPSPLPPPARLLHRGLDKVALPVHQQPLRRPPAQLRVGPVRLEDFVVLEERVQVRHRPVRAVFFTNTHVRVCGGLKEIEMREAPSTTTTTPSRSHWVSQTRSAVTHRRPFNLKPSSLPPDPPPDAHRLKERRRRGVVVEPLGDQHRRALARAARVGPPQRDAQPPVLAVRI